MKVLVDTSVWSLMLRPDPTSLSSAEASLVKELQDLVNDGRVQMIGPVRQELLTGVKHEALFKTLLHKLRSFSDLSLEQKDYEYAAQLANVCISAGIAVTNVDLLVCAVALLNDWPVFSTDKDFAQYQRVLKIRLHKHDQR